MKLIIPLCVLIAYLRYTESTHFVVGNVLDRVQLVSNNTFEYNAFPFFKRVKNFFYSGPEYMKIQGIQALDKAHTKANVSIIAGGLGYSYVTLKFESERGTGLDYDIGVYARPEYNRISLV